MEQGTCVTARRDVAGKEGKEFGVPLEAAAFVQHVEKLLEDIQASLLRQAAEFRDANIVDVASYDELKAAVAEGAGDGGEDGVASQKRMIRCLEAGANAGLGG